MKTLLSLPVYFLASTLSLTVVHASAETLRYNLVEGLPDVHIAPMSEKIGHTWIAGHVWEKHLIQRFYSLLRDHDAFFVALDLGAQTGCFSLLAKYFPDSTWYAFEPIAEAVDTLRKNLALNNIHHVFVYQTAVADFSGKTILRMPEMNQWGLSTVGPHVSRFNVALEREVDCIDVDGFVAAHGIKKVHFMKLDTEGSELSILRGARNTILRDHPIMIIEYNEVNMKQCGVLKSDVDAFLTELGYDWTLVSGEDILCIAKDHGH